MIRLRNLLNSAIQPSRRHGFSEFILVLALIFTIPLTHKEMFSVGLPDLVVSKFIYAVIAALGYLALIRSRGTSGKNILIVLYALFVGFHVLSLIQSRDFINSFQYVIFQITVLGGILFFTRYFSQQPKQIRVVVFASMAALWTTCIFLIIQQVLFSMFGTKTGGIWPVPGYPTRFGSFFWDVNHYGIYIVSMIFLVMGILVSTVKNDARDGMKVRKHVGVIVLLLLTICAGIYALFLTGSRSAMVAGTVSSLFFAFLVLTQKRIKRIDKASSKYLMSILPLAVISGFFSILYVFADAIQNVFLYRAVSFFSHLYLVVTGVRVASDHLFTGIGTNAFSAYFRTSPYAQTYYYIDAAAINQKLPLHNLWLETLSETGIVSFLVFLIFWMLLIGSLIRLYREKNDVFSLGLASGLVSFLVGGLMYSYKSEFFTVYVAIAVAYVSVYLFPRHQDVALGVLLRNQLVSIFKSISQVRDAVMVTLAIAILLSPLLTFVSALSSSDVLVITSGSQGLFSEQFDYLVTLFRYLFGNYSYVPRSIPFIFYLATYFSLIAFFRRIKFVGVLSFFIGSVMIFGMNGFTFGFALSPRWMSLFALCSLILIISTFISLPHFKSQLRLNVSSRVLIGCILFSLFLASFGQYRTTQLNKNRYSEDASFLLELAHNRRIFHDAQLVRDTHIPESLFQYYCNDVYHVQKAYIITSCNSYVDDQQSLLIPGSLRDVYVGSRAFIARYETGLKSLRKVEVLERNDSAILISEPLDR